MMIAARTASPPGNRTLSSAKAAKQDEFYTQRRQADHSVERSKKTMELKKVKYADLNARQKENFNCMKLVGKLADYGYVSMRLTDDWEGADLIACHIDGQSFLRIQLKGRCCFYEKYKGKDLWIAFRDGDDWYLFPHDDVLNHIRESGRLDGTKSWDERGGYSFPYLTEPLKALLSPYKMV